MNCIILLISTTLYMTQSGKIPKMRAQWFVKFVIIHDVIFVIFTFFTTTDYSFLGLPFRWKKFSKRINNRMFFIAHLNHMMCKPIFLSNFVMLNMINMITIIFHAISTRFLFFSFLNKVFLWHGLTIFLLLSIF